MTISIKEHREIVFRLVDDLGNTYREGYEHGAAKEKENIDHLVDTIAILAPEHLPFLKPMFPEINFDRIK